MKSKTCTKCDEMLPTSEFYKHSITKDGLSYWCKNCQRKNTKQWEKTASGIYSTIKGRIKYHQNHPERRGMVKSFSISRKDLINIPDLFGVLNKVQTR